LKQGFNVLHYTLELSEVKVGVRYDSYLCDIDANDVLDRKDEIIKKYEKMKDLGRLIIKQYPMNVATIYTIRSHIERCRVRGFVPNVIMLDYADVMRSTRQFDSLRHELKLVYEELRGYADEIGIPLWTASQSNKEGSNNEIVDLGNMSEAYGKAMVADVVISISRRTFEKATGYGRLYIAKNRAGRDGGVYPVRINTARSRFEVTGNANMLEEANKDDETIMKTRIRSKLKSIAQDKAIDVKGKV
jgi:replicative DNA helicase